MATKPTPSNAVLGHETLPVIAEDIDDSKTKEAPKKEVPKKEAPKKEDTKTSDVQNSKPPLVAAVKSESAPPAQVAASSEDDAVGKITKSQSLGSVVPPKRPSGAMGRSSLHMRIVNKIRADFAVKQEQWAQQKADLEAKHGALEGTVESMKKGDEENRAKIKALEDELAEQKRVHEERVQALQTELAEARDEIQKYENSEAALGYEVSSLTEQLAAARQKNQELKGRSVVTPESTAEPEPIAGATADDAYHLMVDEQPESETAKMPKKCCCFF